MANKIFLGREICAYNAPKAKPGNGLADFLGLKRGLTRYDRDQKRVGAQRKPLILLLFAFSLGAGRGLFALCSLLGAWVLSDNAQRSVGAEFHPSQTARRVGQLPRLVMEPG